MDRVLSPVTKDILQAVAPGRGASTSSDWSATTGKVTSPVGKGGEEKKPLLAGALQPGGPTLAAGRVMAEESEYLDHRCETSYGKPPAFVAHFALGAGTFAQGYDQTSLGFLLATQYGGHLNLSAWEQGVVTAIFFFGGVIGAYLSAHMNEWMGRKAPLLIAAVVATIGGCLGTTTTWFPWLLFVRTVYGVGMGMNQASLAIYLPEITRKKERGSVVAMTEVMFGLGGVFACFVQLALQTGWDSPFGQRNGWRVLVGLEAIPGLVMIVGSLNCVESPRLLQKGRDVDAEKILHRIYAPRKLKSGGCNCVATNLEMEDALAWLRTQLEDAEGKTPERERKLGSVVALICSPEKRVRRAFEINILMAAVPLVGIGCIPQQFIPLMLGLKGARVRDAVAIPMVTLLVDLSCNAVYTLGATLQVVYFVDRIGRRLPLFIAFLGAAVGFLLDGKVFAPELQRKDRHSLRLTVALSGITLGYICRSIGVGPLPQVVASEVIPLEILTRGKSLSSMVRRFTAMFYCLFLPPLFDSLGGFTVFMCQGVLCIAYALFVWLRLPETRGYDITEIQHILEVVEWVPFTDPPPRRRPTDVNLRKRIQQLADSPSGSPRAGGAGDESSAWEDWDIWGGGGLYRT